MQAAPELILRNAAGFPTSNGEECRCRGGKDHGFHEISSRFGWQRGENRIRENFWRTAKKAARHVPFMEDVVAAYYCALDKQTPLRVKGILFAALGYFILPADTIPDVLFAARLHRRRGRADGGAGGGPRPPQAGASGGGERGALRRTSALASRLSGIALPPSLDAAVLPAQLLPLSWPSSAMQGT